MFARFVVPLALDRRGAVGDRADHRLAPGDACPSSGGAFTFPVALGAGHAARARLRARGDPARVRAADVRRSGAFVVATVAQEFFRGVRARRAMTGESPRAALVALVRAQPAALRRLHRPRRRGVGAGGRGRVDVVPAFSAPPRCCRARAPASTAMTSATCARPPPPPPRRSPSARCWRSPGPVTA